MRWMWLLALLTKSRNYLKYTLLVKISFSPRSTYPTFFFFFNPLKSTPQDTPSPQECTIKEATTTIEFSLVMMHMSFPLSSLEFLFQHHNLYFQLKDSAGLPMPPGIFPSQPKVRLAWESISKDGKTKFLRSLNANFKTITNKSNGKQLWNNS